MRLLSRSLLAVLPVLLASTGQASAQKQSDGTRWYFGPQVGVMVFKTPIQSATSAITAGVQVHVSAHHTALTLAYDEAFRDNNQSQMLDPTAPSGVRNVAFNNVGRISASITAVPLDSHFQPYIGVGFGILLTVKNYPDLTGLTTGGEVAAAQDLANSAGSYGYGALVLGVQFKAGPVMVFGEGQVSSSPGIGKLLTGANYTLIGGIRISLGSAHEDISGLN
ncbi:MAG: hypothetical protein ACHQ2E_08155 [Gemmatimonadales bacterium]